MITPELHSQDAAEPRYQGPWLGLEPYQEGDADRFFGRTREIEGLAETIRENLHTTVYGPSGAGKTSLLRAGVFPRLRGENMIPVYIRLAHDSGAPAYRSQILSATGAALESQEVEIEPLVDAAAEGHPESLWAWFHRHEFWDARNRLVKPVIVLDQFEELFTLGMGREDSSLIIAELGDLCSNTVPGALEAALKESGGRLGYASESQGYRVIMSLREDFLARLEEITVHWPELRKNRVSVQAMDVEQALEAVLLPGGALVNESVAHAIVNAVSGADGEDRNRGSVCAVEPALLSLFCSRLDYHRWKAGANAITLEQVEHSRHDILDSFYVDSMAAVSLETREFVEDQLLTSSGYRCAKALDDVQQAKIPVQDINTLVARRLLRYDFRDGLRWIEFSHDILTALARDSRDRRRASRQIERQQQEMAELRRERDRQRHRARLAIGFSAMLLISVVALAMLVWYGFFKEHRRYYHSWKKVYGLPVGIKELSKGQIGHRSVSYELTANGWWQIVWNGLTPSLVPAPVKKMVAVNGYLKPTINHGVTTYLWSMAESHADGDATKTCYTTGKDTTEGSVGADDLAKVCQWEFVTGEDGRPVHEVGKDKDGNVVWGLVYAPSKRDGSGDGADAIPEWKTRACVHFVDKDGYPQKQRKDRAEYVEITYETEAGKEGLEKRIEYRDAAGHRVAGVDGSEARVYGYDAQGREVSLASQKWSDDKNAYENMLDRAGNTGMMSHYNEEGNIAEIVSFGVDGNPAPVAAGYVYARMKYDEWGNQVSTAFFDGENKAAFDNTQTHETRTKYDDHGNAVGQSHYDCDGGAWLNKDGYHGWRAEYDGQGRITKQIYVGLDGKPVSLADYFTEVRSEYDERGNIVRQTYFGADGEPCLHKDGNHGWFAKYDGQGRTTEYVYLGVDGNPMTLPEKYSGFHNEYDGDGRVTLTAYYGVDGKPCLHKDGNHGWRAKYDERGREIERTYFGLDGRPVALSDGYAISRVKWDEVGNQIEWACFDADGHPVLDATDKTHRIERDYDNLGNRIHERYFGTGGNPCKNNLGVFAVAKKYDENRRVIEERYFDADGEPMENPTGIHYGTVKYAACGKMAELKGYDLSGNLHPFSEGAAAVKRWEYDEDGNETICEMFGVDEARIAGENGYAVVKRTYAENRPVTEAYFGVSMEPVPDKASGVHRFDRVYDIRGNITRELYYDTEGDPCQNNNGIHGWSGEYDDRSLLTAQTILGADGRPALGSSGYATTRKKYDDEKRVVDERYFGVGGEPVENSEGIHYGTVSYAPCGKMAELRGYDRSDRLHSFEEGGVAVKRWTYDETGNETSCSTFGVDERPVNGDNGYAAVVKTCGGNGETLSESYFGVAMEPVVDTSSSVHRIERQYDEQGNRILELFFDIEGQPCVNKAGCAQVRYTYDDSGKQKEETCLDVAGDNVQTTMNAVMVAEVFPGTPAAKAGIKAESLILLYEDWDWSKVVEDPDLAQFQAALDKSVDKKKHLVLWTGSDFQSYQLAVGKMGLHLVDKPLPIAQVREIWQAFSNWQTTQLGGAERAGGK